jgi:sugar phosphate isomerase/epimerase
MQPNCYCRDVQPFLTSEGVISAPIPPEGQQKEIKMNLMICLRGEPEQLPFLPEIAALGAGIELGSYGLVGIQSERDWDTRFSLHQALRAQFQGPIALHGPFIGIEYNHIDHLIRAAVNRRLDMTFDVALKLDARRVVLHSGYSPMIDLFKLQDAWLKRCVAFWCQEIRRWADAGIEIVLENDVDKSPDLLVRLVDEVDHPFLGLCLDIGHQHVFSELAALDWVRRMEKRLFHIHLHDNDGTSDNHWSIGRGTIDFEPFYAAIMQHVPQATLSLEVEDTMEVKLRDLRKLAAYFASK